MADRRERKPQARSFAGTWASRVAEVVRLRRARLCPPNSDEFSHDGRPIPTLIGCTPLERRLAYALTSKCAPATLLRTTFFLRRKPALRWEPACGRHIGSSR